MSHPHQSVFAGSSFNHRALRYKEQIMNSKVGGSLPEKRILAIFQPQEWVDGPEGAARDVGCAATFDATKAVLRMPLAFIHRLKDASEDADYIHTYSDTCLDHFPYEVKLVSAVQEFFGVKRLIDITEDMLLHFRRQYGPLSVDADHVGDRSLFDRLASMLVRQRIALFR